LNRGALAVELLKQPQQHPYSLVDEVLLLFLLKENFLEHLKPAEVQPFVTEFISYVQSVYNDLYNALYESKDITEEDTRLLFDIAKEFSKLKGKNTV
jgi:F-type H+-transporting ATPase subunit alpha